jgi:hypothetical protein
MEIGKYVRERYEGDFHTVRVWSKYRTQWLASALLMHSLVSLRTSARNNCFSAESELNWRARERARGRE